MPICAICGREVERVTNDHIPPKSMFGMKPSNLITVPACLDCNGGSSTDDEYFRLIASEVDTATHPDAQQASKAIARSMARPQASSFRESLRKSVYGIEVDEGSSTKVKPYFGLDVQRLDSTAKKIVKGLFYHVKGYPVPASHKVLAANLDLFMENPLSVDLAKLIVNYLLPKCSWIQPKVIGNEVFTYQVFCEDDAPNTVFVLMQFYKRWRYFGLVLESDS